MNKGERSVNTLGVVDHTARGFEVIQFHDRYAAECSLQQSSLADYELPGTSAIWLGRDLDHCMYRMHLSIDQVQALIRHLQAWLDTGSFQVKEQEEEEREHET